MTLEELNKAVKPELDKLLKRDAREDIASRLTDWSWELSAKFGVPILVMHVPHFPGSAIIAVPLPCMPTDGLDKLKADLERASTQATAKGEK
jgi:hypothetical protein